LNYELECWSRWLLQTRLRGPHGKDTLDFLSAIRDRVLDRAQLVPGDYVLDVGSGDGLLAFAALHRVGPHGLVVVDDISQGLLDECSQVASAAGVVDRMRFILNDATDLRDVPEASIDAVLTRSVLMYVQDKAAAVDEFRRVLRPGGRVSIFEPISRVVTNRCRFGIDPGPIAGLAERVEAAYSATQSPETGSMLNFDERDLLQLFVDAGFARLDLELHVKSRRERKDPQWFDTLLDGSGQLWSPCLRGAVAQALSEDEAETYAAFYRNAVATIGVATTQAFAYISGSIDL
jgi:ubiquinone/menaquinone biosynthesis C-methylase UbiE